MTTHSFTISKKFLLVDVLLLITLCFLHLLDLSCCLLLKVVFYIVCWHLIISFLNMLKLKSYGAYLKTYGRYTYSKQF